MTAAGHLGLGYRRDEKGGHEHGRSSTTVTIRPTRTDAGSSMLRPIVTALSHDRGREL
jgi:hypothetical protein